MTHHPLIPLPFNPLPSTCMSPPFPLLLSPSSFPPSSFPPSSFPPSPFLTFPLPLSHFPPSHFPPSPSPPSPSPPSPSPPSPSPPSPSPPSPFPPSPFPPSPFPPSPFPPPSVLNHPLITPSLTRYHLLSAPTTPIHMPLITFPPFKISNSANFLLPNISSPHHDFLPQISRFQHFSSTQLPLQHY